MVTHQVAADGPAQSCEWDRQGLKMSFFAYISETTPAKALKFGMVVGFAFLVMPENGNLSAAHRLCQALFFGGALGHLYLYRINF